MQMGEKRVPDKQVQDKQVALVTGANQGIGLQIAKDLASHGFAEASAEDWLRELMASNDLPASGPEWRTLTIAAATRLASRVNTSIYQKRRLA